jgi:sec-independent protein translocase protein TatA
MFDGLFDSPWKLLIVAIVIIVLFGSRKLPDAARSLGKSMRILKTEVQGLHEDEPAAPPATVVQPPAPAQLQATASEATASEAGAQAQIEALKQQVQNLQQAVGVNATTDGKQAG